MGDEDFPYVEIPDDLREYIGEPDDGTRMYRAFGYGEHHELWWDAVIRIAPESRVVSPGGVSMYAKVSRAGVYKRMKEGRLTAFLYHDVNPRARSKYDVLKHGGRPYIYIPVSECKAWQEQLEQMPSREERSYEAHGDGWEGDSFLTFSSKKYAKILKQRRIEEKKARRGL